MNYSNPIGLVARRIYDYFFPLELKTRVSKEIIRPAHMLTESIMEDEIAQFVARRSYSGYRVFRWSSRIRWKAAKNV